MALPYIFSVYFTPFLKGLYMCVCGWLFFLCPGQISNFYYSLSHSTVFCFNLRGLEPSFASSLEKGRDCYKYKAISMHCGSQCFFQWCCSFLLECYSWSTLIQVHHFIYEIAQQLLLPKCLAWPIPIQSYYPRTQSSFRIYVYHVYYIISTVINLFIHSTNIYCIKILC